jgi:hypothetical protein
MTIEDKVKHVYMREVMKTSVDGGYSGKATLEWLITTPRNG